MILLPSRISRWPSMSDFGWVRLMNICTNQSRTLRILSSGGLLTVIFTRAFITWLWTILASLVSKILIRIGSHLTNFTPNSHINCCWTRIFTGPPTFVFHSQPPRCFVYSRIPLSRFLGLPWSHFFWGCSCGCEKKFQEEARGIWFRCWGHWVVNMSWIVVCNL